jgi:hypothetical protein
MPSIEKPQINGLSATSKDNFKVPSKNTEPTKAPSDNGFYVCSHQDRAISGRGYGDGTDTPKRFLDDLANANDAVVSFDSMTALMETISDYALITEAAHGQSNGINAEKYTRLKGRFNAALKAGDVTLAVAILESAHGSARRDFHPRK